MANSVTRGKALRDLLAENLRAFRRGPVGGRDRPIIWGVTTTGAFVDGMTLAGFLAAAGGVVRDGGRVYVWRDTLVLECGEPGDERLLLLATRRGAEPSAASVLTNLFGVGCRVGERASQSMVPGRLAGALLADEDLWRRLPRIEFYARRPLFDDDFELCGPGWNAGRNVLIHGPDVEPIPPPARAAGADNLGRLPPHLRRLLQGFCWASQADLANAVAVLLTGFLSNHFVDEPKPVVIIDGNQKGLGKTLFVQAVGRVLDAAEPPRIPLVRDEELEKKLCAQLRDGSSGVFFFDNVRQRIDSPLIEANALSPVLSFRILGQSATVSRPNTYLWVITSNQTSGTEDFISRGLPVRLHYEGNPRERTFGEHALDLARRCRAEILGELAGMVLHWKEMGRPQGRPKHRCARWARVVGGVLEAAGLRDFLANVEEAEASMDEEVQALGTLAEYVVGRGRRAYYAAGGEAVHKDTGALPRDWTQVFLEAEVHRDKLADRSARGRDTWVGTFLSGKTDRNVAVVTAGGNATATLRRNVVRGDQKRYYFEVVAPGAGDGAATPAAGGDGSGPPAAATAAGEGETPAKTEPAACAGEMRSQTQPAAAGGCGRVRPAAGGQNPATTAVDYNITMNDLEWF